MTRSPSSDAGEISYAGGTHALALAGQPPRVAEEGHVVFDDIRAIPVTGSLSRHGSSGSTRRRHGEETRLGDDGPRQHFGKLQECGGGRKREEEE